MDGGACVHAHKELDKTEYLHFTTGPLTPSSRSKAFFGLYQLPRSPFDIREKSMSWSGWTWKICFSTESALLF